MRALPLGLRLAVLLLLGARTALAHQSYVELQTGIANEGMSEEAISAQWGLGRSFPAYLHVDAIHDQIPHVTRDDSYRFDVEASWEERHFGLKADFGQIYPSQAPYFAVMFGGTATYRFASWGSSLLDDPSETREEKKKDDLRKDRESHATVPTASLLFLSIDAISLTSASATVANASIPELSATLQWKIVPDILTLWPKLGVFVYSVDFAGDPAAAAALSSRSLRLLRIAHDGPWLTLFGVPVDFEQLYLSLKLDPLLTLRFATTTATLNTPLPSGRGWSFWLGFDRWMDDAHKLAFTPLCEMNVEGGSVYSFLGLQLRYSFNGAWLPE
jgi:hypothetical protein